VRSASNAVTGMLSLLSSCLDLGLLALGRKFLAWWVGELAALFPARLRQIWHADPRRLSILVDHAGFEVCAGTLDRQGPAVRGERLPRGAWADIERLIKTEKRRYGPLLTIAVRVPISACLVRHKHLPAQALGQAEGLLLLDLEQATPLKRQEVYWGWHCPSMAKAGTIEVHQLVLKRSRIDPVIDQLKALRLSPVAIEVSDETGRVLPLNLLVRRRQLPKLEAWLRNGILMATVVAAVLTVLVVGYTSYRQEQALASLDAESQLLRQKAADIRRKLASAEGALSQVVEVRRRRAETSLVVQLWEELTQVLPDSTWITEFRFDGAGVSIDGFAPSASELVGLLARSVYFKEVAFASPVTRDPQRGLERFQIRMRIANGVIRPTAEARATR
jgi:general secretion pathway protein L